MFNLAISRWLVFSTAALCLGACKRSERESGQPPSMQSHSPRIAPAKPAQEPERPELASDEVARRIRSELEQDGHVSARHIIVQYSNGVVELTGWVEDLLSKQRAAKVAQSLRGVLSVSNRVEVRPPAVADGELEARLRMAITLDAVTDSLDVTVAVKNGITTLRGQVDSWVEKDVAERVAMSVRGVRAIQNELTVSYPGKRSDEELRSDVLARLRWDTLVQATGIEISADNGVVALSGYVGSAAERDRAYRLAGWVLGVRGVDVSGLAVRPTTDDENVRNPHPDEPGDRQISDAIRAALLMDPRVKSYSVTPAVSGGFVTLRGRVDHVRARLAAESIARNTVGVVEVKNEIGVVPSSTVTDRTIERRVRSALDLDSAIVRDEAIEVFVRQGKVTLRGRVRTHFQRARAEDLAGRIRNVVAVENELQVTDARRPYAFDAYHEPYEPLVSAWRSVPRTTSAEDRAIRESIVSELAWSPFVDADEVNVTVAQGKATLTGRVDSLAEKRAAAENATEGGAIFVDNLLKVGGN